MLRIGKRLSDRFLRRNDTVVLEVATPGEATWSRKSLRKQPSMYAHQRDAVRRRGEDGRSTVALLGLTGVDSALIDYSNDGT